MRTLKFRAWDGKQMTFWGFHPDHFAGPASTNDGNPLTMIHMQFTGLRDKNRKEIYEGDIVNARNWGLTNEILTVSVVEWDIDAKGWGLTPEPTDDRYDLFRNIEVIGNIYENPELVKSDA